MKVRYTCVMRLSSGIKKTLARYEVLGLSTQQDYLSLDQECSSGEYDLNEVAIELGETQQLLGEDDIPRPPFQGRPGGRNWLQ